MTSLRSVCGVSLAALVAVVGLMSGSVQADSGKATVQKNPTSAGLHTYNPNAPVGSADNPEILDGQDQAVLSPQQVKELIAAKQRRLEQARTRQASKIAAGCIIGAYWSTCKQYQGFGQINLATELRSGHEWIRQQGWLYGGGMWETYMDISTDGGASWDGRKSLVINATSWGEYVNDTSPRVARGCLYNSVTHYVGCTGWH
ncbi:hypothetical protein [Streptomyces venezuelae]|uniref:hypothetical protein n=1 Tax=Streptomyces venezuelae TaxID=54571 RepID=UPI00278BE5BC|nr:hypothetical protein [Streptomyces venezuelae]